MPKKNEILSSRLDDLVKMRTALLPNTWKRESALMMNRWFDYRFTSPISLTLQFGRIYQEKLRAHIRRHEDIGKASMVNGTKNYVPLEREEFFTSLWNARQRADEFFLPYEDYVDFCFEFSSRRKRYWNMKPGQLHPSAANKDAWLGCFDEFYADRMPSLIHRAGDISQYRLENDLNLPAQNAFREMILSVMQASGRHMADQIAERVYSKRHISISSALELVKEDYRDDVAKNAMSLFNGGAWPAETETKLEAVNLLPSCFGVLETIDITAPPCSTCPMSTQCLKFGQQSLNATERLTGFSSPALHFERERNRKNTANHRTRKEEAATAT